MAREINGRVFQGGTTDEGAREPEEGITEGIGAQHRGLNQDQDSRQRPTSTSIKRKRLSRSSDGDDVDGAAGDEGDQEEDDDVHHDMNEATIGRTLNHSKLNGLRDRRADMSPEKFNKGKFEALSIQPAGDEQVLKKRRLEANTEITYDSAGTPRINIFSPRAPNTSITTPRDSNESSASRTPLEIKEILLNIPTTSTDPNKPNRKTFSILHGLCRDNDLLLHFVSFLDLPSLLSLYSIDKAFHFLFNRTPTAFVLSSMRTWAPNADKIFPWHCYRSLCLRDPSRLQKARLAGKEDQVKRKWDDLRDVPSLRWLQMVVWREGVCQDMLVMLAMNGLRVPVSTLEAVKKMWFLMDLPLNSHRIALVRSRNYISNDTLVGWTWFLLKVDMLFTDPMAAPDPANHPNQRLYPNKWAGLVHSGVPLRKMLLAERHMSSLWRVMRGWSWDGGFGKRSYAPMNKLDILKLWVRHKYTPAEDLSEETKKESIMGIPWYEVGTAALERTGVAFHDLTHPETKEFLRKIPIVNPAIAGTGLTDHQTEQILYPHKKRLILPNEKRREILLGPDELLIKEGIRRKMQLHKMWGKIMFAGFVDSVGNNIKLPTEEEVLQKLRRGTKEKDSVLKVKREARLEEMDGKSSDVV